MVHTEVFLGVVVLRVRLVAAPLLADGMETGCGPLAQAGGFLRALAAPVHSDVEIETAIIGLGREPGGGLVVSSDALMFMHRVPLILAAARNNVPAVYWASVFARGGGLLSYGVDQLDNFRRATTYVDRILRGAKLGDLPVQFPVKYEMVVNLKTAKALGLTVPRSILARADDVIE